MLNLIEVARGGEKEFTVEWMIEQRPVPTVATGFILTKLTATGNELELIARMFPAWVPLGQSWGYWHGDLAKTILGCLQVRFIK